VAWMQILARFYLPPPINLSPTLNRVLQARNQVWLHHKHE
jgi:hypothetical protein